MSTDPSIWGSGAVKEEVLIPGPPGPPPELVQGATSETMGAPQATLTPIGEGKYRIDWVLKTGKEGSKGNTGATGTVASATVEMIPHDQPATVTVSGTPPNQSMHFKLPRQTPTPGVAGPPGKLQNVRGVLPDDQTVIDLYAEGGPPDTVLLNVLKSSDTVKVSVSETGIITFKAVGGGPAPEPFKPSQISYLIVAHQPITTDDPIMVQFGAIIPELGEPFEAADPPAEEYIVTTEKFIRVNVSFSIAVTGSPTGTITLFGAVAVNGGFPVVSAISAMSLPEGVNNAQVQIVSGLLPVTTGDEVQIMLQSSVPITIMQGGNMNIERFY